MTNIYLNSMQAIAATNKPTPQRGWVNDCKSIIYKQNKALKSRFDVVKGRPDVKHGCNPCAETPTQHKGKPRLLLLLLALVAIATTVQAQSVVTYVERDGVAYKLWNDNTASIPSREEHRNLTGTLTLHQTITHNSQNYTLTKIEDIAFSNADGLEGTLTIPPTVTYIGVKAFYSCSFRGELIIPSSVQTIGGEAFEGNYCSSLVVGDGVTSIGNMAFRNCDFSSVVLGANVESIGNTAFGRQAASMQDLQVECRSAVPPALGTNVFQNCTVTQVTAPPCGLAAYQASTHWNGFNLYEKRINVQIDGVYYVLHCSSKTALVTHAGYMEDNSNLGSYSDDVTIPETLTHEGETYDVTRIGDNAFRNCTSLNSIVIGDNVTSIGNYAFLNCTSLTSITINNPVPPALGEAVFYAVPATAVLNVPSTATEAYAAAEQWRYFFETRAAQIGGVYYLMSLIDGTATVTHAGYTETNTNNGSYMGNVTIPATVTYEGQTYNVTRIGEYAFCFCYSLASVTLGDNVRDIGDFAFHDCSMLASVTLGDNVRDIGRRAFYNCRTLASVNLGDNVRDIGEYAFYNCSMLASVTFGDNVRDIKGCAFQDCTSLASVNLGDNVQRIRSQAFYRCTSLETVVLGKALQIIGSSAFSGCTSLASITSMNPTPPTLSGNNVFNNVPSSAVLYVPCTATEAYAAAAKWNSFGMQSIPEIHNAQIDGVYYVLDGCALTATVTHAGYTEENTNNGSYSGEVTIPATVTYEGQTYNVTRIGKYAFYFCYSLASVTLGDNVRDIGDRAFYNCSMLASVTLGKKVRDIGIKAFYNCSTLASVNLGDNVRDIGSYAFQDCTSLASVTFGKNVREIKGYAFQDCTSLASVNLGDNVQRIRSQAFYRCTSLETVVLGKALQRIESSAFSGCTSLASITSMNPTPPTLVGNTVFYNVPSSAVLYVPCAAMDAYAAAEKWNVFSNMEGMKTPVLIDGIYYTLCGGTATVVGHPSYATLMGANIDVTVHFNGTDYPVVGIEAGAFDGCTELESFDCHFTLTELGDYTFRGCTSLLSVGLYNTDTPPALGEGVFEGIDFSELYLLVPECSQQEYSQHATFGQFGYIFGNGNCGYTFTNQNGNGDKKWSNAANWQGGEVPGEDARVGIFEDCEIDEDVTVGSITIGSYIDEEWGYYERLTVKDGATLTVTSFIYNSGDARNFVIEDGAQVIHPNGSAKATIEKNITAYTPNAKDGWHLVSSPAIESFAPTVDNGFLANEYDLYFYDEPAHYWRNYKPSGQYAGFYIEPLKGYLYANSANDTLGLTGTLRAATETVDIPLSYTDDIELAGFNLVGNPFAHNVTTFTGSNVADEIYRMNGTKDNLVVSVIDGDNPLKPGEGFFVKATGEDATITFNDNGGAKGGTKALEPVERPTIALEISQNGLLIDRLIQKTEGAPLEKFTLNENGTKIYATEGGEEYAVAVVGRDAMHCVSTETPVHFKAAQNGTYTLTVNVENMDLDYLHLIDNLTGEDVDMLASPTYTFAAKTSDYISRFRLVFSAAGASAGSASDAPFAYISNGEIVINGEGTLQVIDMLGHVVRAVGLSHRGSRTTTTGMPAGMYVLRLIEGDSVKTQKIVIP